MAEESLASAVAVPEPEPASPEKRLKRRQSSISDSDPKRRRLSTQGAPDRSVSPRDSRKSPPRPDNSTAEERRSGRRGAGAVEERKRGQRLFGALLGTLSQSSSTTAQKRRADIEQRQQTKLKLQDEEYGEVKRKKREDMIAERKSRQRGVEREALATRHRNLLAMARFLGTKTEPVLYYRPWQLRSEEEDKIDDQIEETEKLIAKEEAEFEKRYRQTEEQAVPRTHRDEQPKGNDASPRPEDTQADNDTKEDNAPISKKSDSTEANEQDDKATEESRTEPATSTVNSHEHDESPRHEASRGHEDDGEEVMEEDKEDMVIY